MEILRTVKDLTDYTDRLRARGKSIGLVPTMGALHAGHASLMDIARPQNDVVIASLFVNPTQFNNPEDLRTYPRTEQADFALLEKHGVDAVFAPSVEEVYPPEQNHSDYVFDLGQVAEVMEGAMRPGHFQGVAQIVAKLMRMACPTRAYFGEKDFQQIAVIRRMVATEHIDVEVIACPIKRDADGLALSSRNVRLTPEQRATAPGIYKALHESTQEAVTKSVKEVQEEVVNAINALPQCKVEYFSIVDAATMQPVNDWNDAEDIQGCITVYCGDVRLIDNINYKQKMSCCSK